MSFLTSRHDNVQPRSRKGRGRTLSLLALVTLSILKPDAVWGQEYGVYMRIADWPAGTVAEVATQVEKAVEGAGWNLLASYPAGVRLQDCAFEARVLVVDWPEYTQAVLSQGTHGAFAAPLRISVFQDELGVHVAAVNPRSLNRTMVAEEGMDEDWARLSDEFRSTLTAGMGATPAEGEFGQFRKKGRIGKTLGIMAGGPFKEKIETITTVEGEVDAVSGALFQALQEKEPGEEWGMRAVYLMKPAEGVAVIGITGERMEKRSFSIVGRGSDKSRSDLACPGIDHAAAYPVGVVLTQEEGGVQISLVDEMFRMKMYFEDAGKMKFARNMGMPGSMEDEIRELILSALF